MKIFKSLSLAIVASALVVGCGTSKKKAEDSNAAADVGGTPTADISSQAVSFDPEGSDSGKIEGLGTVHFDYDKSNLSSETREQLKTNMEWIKSHPDVVVQVEGHCDSRGSVEYNLALGERRAQAVKKYLVSLGVDAKRLTVISYGKEKLLDTGSSEAAHAKNRRANFVPLPK